VPTTEARVGAGDLDPSQRGRGDTAFPRTRALWVSRAGSSMRNLWRASVFRKRSPPVVASNSHEGCRDPVLRALPQARPGGVLVSANDTPLDSPPRGETGSRVPPILLRFELGHHRLEDRSKGWMVSRLLLQSMALLPALVCRGFQCYKQSGGRTSRECLVRIWCVFCPSFLASFCTILLRRVLPALLKARGTSNTSHLLPPYRADSWEAR